MKENNKISVVMSVYKGDRAKHFSKSVNSLLSQTHMPSEIIIVVDGEVDEKVNLELKYFSKIKIISILRLKVNQGLSNALNVGIKKAKHNLIARMDADDICFEDRFEKQMSFLVSKQLDFVGGQMVEFSKSIEDVISYRKVPVNHNQIVPFMKLRAPFSHPTILFKKEVFERLKGYDTQIFPEDYDFFVRVYLNGFKMGNLEDNVLWFRLGEDLSAALKRRWGKKYAKNEYKLYKKFLKIGFYTKKDFLKAIIFKIPLRLIPFSIFKFLYFKILR